MHSASTWIYPPAICANALVAFLYPFRIELGIALTTCAEKHEKSDKRKNGIFIQKGLDELQNV